MKQLLESATAIENSSQALGVNNYEPIAIWVLNLILNNPKDIDDFKDVFFACINQKQECPIELLEYCMHVLQWDDVFQEIRNCIRSTSNPRTRDVLGRVVDAYNEDWEDVEDFYPFLQKHGREKVIKVISELF